MPILQTCCCFNNVWKGSLACAIYTILAYSYYFATEIWTIDEINKHLNGTGDPESRVSKLGYTTKTHMVLSSINAFNCFCVVITSIILIIGLFAKKRQYLLPWIVQMIVDLVYGFFHIGYFVITATGDVRNILVSMILMYSLMVILNAYCITCVISQYQVYKGTANYQNSSPNHSVKYDTVYNNGRTPVV